MRIAHASDTHNHPEWITAVEDIDCDVILLTGDIFYNATYNMGERVSLRRERNYQGRFGRKCAKRWVPAFRGRDVIYVEGNHDFEDIGRFLLKYGHPADKLHHITYTNPSVTVQGVKFAGFREVPWIEGQWCGEVHDLTPFVEKAMACDPEVLVTHAPPAGILDETTNGCAYGIPSILTWLTYRPHQVRAHFFGHAHHCGGQVREEMGIKFINGACHLKIHEI